MPLFPASSQVPLATPSDLFRRPDDAQVSFVGALRSAGFLTAAISAHVWTGEGTAFAEEFEEMHDLATSLVRRERAYPSAKEVIDHAIDWIRRKKERDYFLYVHLMDPHHPHFFDADAQAFFGASTYPSGRLSGPTARMSKEDRRYANALYDGSMRYTDRHIGRLVEFLRSEELIDSTVIAVTADHGEHLFDPPGEKLFKHGGPWLDPVARIPLIVHHPQTLERGEFDDFSEGVDVGPTLLGLLDVPVPDGKEFDGIDLVTVINGQAPPKGCALVRGGIRTSEHKCLFNTGNNVLLGEQPPELHTLSGKLYNLIDDPHETTDLFALKPEVIADLLQRYRSSLARRFMRYQAARSSEQPRSAFAVSAEHMATEVPLRTAPYASFAQHMAAEASSSNAGGRNSRDRWRRYKQGGRAAIATFNTDEPLSVHFPLPNGAYDLTVNMKGRAVIEVDGRQREVTAGPITELGAITVTDEVFRATIRRQGSPVSLRFFGFNPAAAVREDPKVVEDRLRRLKSLGYVGD